MSYIGKNIRKIRATKGLSQQGFADLFEIKRASVGAYEEGRAEPKSDMAIAIAKHFSITLDQLITKELTVNELSGFNLKNYTVQQEVKPTDRQVSIISSREITAYQANMHEKGFDSENNLITPANFLNGSIVFECSMEFKNESNYNIGHGDYLVCQSAESDSPAPFLHVTATNITILNTLQEVPSSERLYSITQVITATPRLQNKTKQDKMSDLEDRIKRIEDKMN